MKVLVYFSPRDAQGVNEWKVVARRVVMMGGSGEEEGRGKF